MQKFISWMTGGQTDTLKDPCWIVFFAIVAFFAVTFSASGFIHPGASVAVVSIVLAAVAFESIICEDLIAGTVDIRKAGIFAVFLFLASRFTAVDFLYAFFAYFILFRMIYLVISLWCTIKYHQPRQGTKIVPPYEILKPEDTQYEDEPEIAGHAIPFVPCYALGVASFLAVLLAYCNRIPVITDLNDAMSMILSFMAPMTALYTLGVLIVAWVVLELISFFVFQRYKQVIGLGMGDVLVLPTFAAFLGGAYFTMTLFLSLIFVVVEGALEKWTPKYGMSACRKHFLQKMKNKDIKRKEVEEVLENKH